MIYGHGDEIYRYGDKAEEMAAAEKDETRKKELLRIASNCHNVAEGVPNDIWEAMQLWHIATNMIIIEANGHSVTYGRFDQIFKEHKIPDDVPEYAAERSEFAPRRFAP